MSMLLEYKGKFYSFSNYVTLTEAVKPTKVLYGTNPMHGKSPKNLDLAFIQGSGDFPKKSKQLKLVGSFHSTWFEEKERLFWVGIDKSGECAFAEFLGNSEGSNYNKTYNPEEILDITKFYTMEATNSMIAIKIFSNVIFVLLQMANKLKLNEIKLEGYNSNLDKFYRLLTINKFFLKGLDDYGWKYDRNSKDTYFYTKI